MKKSIIIVIGSFLLVILTTIGSFILGGTYATTNYQNQVKAYHNYYQKTEILLDSVYSQNEDYFRDVLMETDTYFNYEESRDNLTDMNIEIANYKNNK